MNNNGLGWIPDDIDTRDYNASEYLQSSTSELPQLVNSSHLVQEVYDQGPTGSCVAQAICQALNLTWTAHNQPIKKISRLGLYWQSRAVQGSTTEDAGTKARIAFEVLRKQGYTDEEYWPFDPKNVFISPPLSYYRASFDRVENLSYYRLSTNASARMREAKQALFQSKFFVFGVPVDENFDKLQSTDVWSPGGDVRGKHMICAVGYNEFGIQFVNSWGPFWAGTGFSTISWNAFLDTRITADVIAVDTARPL